MRALTLWQPWASAIALGVKRVETRSWGTDYRGDIAIHAAAKGRNGARREGLHAKCWPAMREAGCDAYLHELPTGSIVAVATLVDVVRIGDDATSRWTAQEILAGDFTAGRCAWVLENIRKVTPLRATGARGLWTLHEDLERTVRMFLGEPIGPRGERVRKDLE